MMRRASMMLMMMIMMGHGHWDTGTESSNDREGDWMRDDYGTVVYRSCVFCSCKQ